MSDCRLPFTPLHSCHAPSHFLTLHFTHPHTLTYPHTSSHSTSHTLTLHLTHPHTSSHSTSHTLTLHLTHPHIPSHFLTLHFTLPYSTPSLEPPSQTAMMMATFSLVSQRRNPHSAVASSSLLMSLLCLPGHWGGGALYSTKTTPSLAQRAENCSSHTGGVGR